MRPREGRQNSGHPNKGNRGRNHPRNRSPLRSRRRSRSPRRQSNSPRHRSIERRDRSPIRRDRSPILFYEDRQPSNFLDCPRGILNETNTDFRSYSPRRSESRYSPPRENSHDNFTMIRPELNFEPSELNFEEPEPQPLQLWSRPESQQPNQEERSWRSNETQQMFISSEELHPDIPEFGFDNRISSKKWIQIFDAVANKEKWNGDKKKMQMASKLVGPAKEWLLSGDRLTEHWRTLRTAFLKTFKDDMDYFQRLQRMLVKVKAPNETNSNYFTFKTSLLKSCDITGRKAVSCLIGGLDNESLKPMLYDQNFDTPELLFNFLLEHEKTRMVPQNTHSGPENMGFTTMISGAVGSREEERTDVLKVIINGVILQAYNDPKSTHVTIKEYQAKLAKLQHNKYRRVIQGYQGSLFTVLGDAHAVIRVGNAVVNTQVFVVPESFQHFPVIIGDSLRQHPSVVFYEDQKGAHFFQKDTVPKDNNSSFAMNQRLVEKMNAIVPKNIPQATTSNNIPSLMQPKVGVPNLGVNQFGMGGEVQNKKRPRRRR